MRCMMTNNSIWMMEPSRLNQLIENTESIVIDPQEVGMMDRLKQEAAELRVTDSGVAIIPIFGVISQHFDIWNYLMGGCACETVRTQLADALASEQVRAILFHVDSPGGSGFGLTELASTIFSARGIKPMSAIANSYAASAGYCLASAASRFVVTPGGLVGSIGTYLLHWDMSGQLEEAGLKPTFVQGGENKTEGNSFEPLDDDTLAHWQSLVDVHYDQFVNDVARNRKTSRKKVLDEFGQGRVFAADEAVKRGMVDGVNTFEDEVARLDRVSVRQAKAKRIRSRVSA